MRSRVKIIWAWDQYLAAIMGLLFAMLSFSAQANGLSISGSISGPLSEDEQKLSPKLFRVATQNSVPKYIPRNAQNKKGLCDLIYDELEKRLSAHNIQLQVVTSPTTIKRILKGMDVGIIDGFCGAGWNKRRDEKYGYSSAPVFYNNIVIVAHKENLNPPKDLAELIARGETIMAFYGTTGAERLKRMPGAKVDDRFTSLMQPLKLIAGKKRYHYFYYHELAVSYLIQRDKMPLMIIPASDEKLPQYMAFSPSLDPAVQQIVDETLSTMYRDGTLEKISEQYRVYYK